MPPEIEKRREIMGLCARANLAELENVGAGRDASAEEIRAPEIGLVMARGRIGGTGQRFNLGEVGVTRAACRLPGGWIGHAYHLGRDRRRARIAAVVDALWQSELRPEIEAALEPVRARIAAERSVKAARAAATRVDFFNMVRGED